MLNEKCVICHQDSLMGLHPRCAIASVLLSPRITEETKTCGGCKTCPFRKDMPTWLNRVWLAIDQIRIRRGIQQNCHQRFAPSRLCGGLQRTLAGGDEHFYTPEEFMALEPAPHEEVLERFDAAKNS